MGICMFPCVNEVMLSWLTLVCVYVGMYVHMYVLYVV
jgi:hypothetical protein